MLTTVEQLEQAIAALDAQRPQLGDAVVKALVSVLREQLAALQPAPALIQEQRKQVTVLFADVSGFTAISESLDAEDVSDLINALWRQIDKIILERGGKIDKHIGDAVMALWGVERAREDDPEQAIRAALAIQEVARNAQAHSRAGRVIEQRPSLAIRIGVNTGPVFLGGVGKTSEFTALGHTVNAASRLQEVAPVGEILISHDTYRHVSGIFDLKPQEPVSIVGISQPVRTYLVQRIRPRALRMVTRGIEGLTTRTVGREAELAQMQMALQQVIAQRKTGLVTLVGEAGVGKSRLLDEFGRWVDMLPGAVRYFGGQALPQAQNLPYSLLRDVFALHFQIMDSDPVDLVREKFTIGVASVLPEEGEMKASILGAWLGYDFWKSPSVAALQQDPGQLHNRGLLYLAQFFSAATSQQPAVLLLEDLHWADRASLEAVADLARRCPDLPLLVVALARPAFLREWPKWGEWLLQNNRIELQPLSIENSRILVAEILRKVNHAPAKLVSLLIHRAEGNPFYLEELVKVLIDEGVIITRDQQWQIEMGRLETLQVPSTLVGILQARLDRLDPLEKRTLQQASVIGRVFWDGAIACLEGDVRALAPLQVREMIYQRQYSSFVDMDEYIFKHVLLRDVVYESVLKRVRRSYHEQAANWLVEVTEQNQRQDEYAPMIAEHFDRAENPAQARNWYTRAGKQAAAQFGHVDAVRWLSRALALTPVGDSAAQYDLLRARTMVYDLQGDRKAQGADLASLAVLVGLSLETEVQAGEAHRAQADVAMQQASYYEVTGDYELAGQAARRAIQLSEMINDRAGAAAGRRMSGRISWRLGDLESASEQYLEALEQARQAGAALVEADSLRGLGLVEADYDRSRSYTERALEIYRQTGNRRGEAMCLNNLGVLAIEQGDHARAQDYNQQAFQLFRKMGDRWGESLGLDNLGSVAMSLGDYPKSQQYHQQALTVARQIGDPWGVSAFLDHLGAVARKLGDYPSALDYYRQAMLIDVEAGNRLRQVGDLRNQALLYLAMKDYEQANACGEQAWAAAQEMGLRGGDLALIKLMMGHIMAARGQFAEARPAYQEACLLFEQIGVQSCVAEARAGLVEVALEQDDLPHALATTELILKFLAKRSPSHLVADACRIYLACYRALHQAGDGRAAAILERSCLELHEQAANIADESMRQVFLTNVSSHCGILAACRELKEEAGDLDD